MKLKLLQETRGGLVKQAREILDTVIKENRALTEEEGNKIAGIEGETSNVIGLSLPLLRNAVNSLGYKWFELIS